MTAPRFGSCGRAGQAASDKNCSEAGSPWSTPFSLPSSQLSTNCTAMRALPGSMWQHVLADPRSGIARHRIRERPEQVAPGDHLDDLSLHSVQMAAMAEGARIASKECWKRGATLPNDSFARPRPEFTDGQGPQLIAKRQGVVAEIE